MRKLIYIPIIHARAELGALAEVVQCLAVKKLGLKEWERNIRAINREWAVIRDVIGKMELPYRRVRLYQDGLPQCGREVQSVMDLARAGSPNHKFLLSLIQEGATLVGTESPDLLVEEYQLVQHVIDAQSRRGAAQVHAQQQSLIHSLLERRDRYIAERINETLQDGETGILFLGMLHSVQEHLDGDIEVSYPIH